MTQLCSFLLARRIAPMLGVLIAGCAQTMENPVVWDSKTAPPEVQPLLVDGQCTLVISGEARVSDKGISHVGLVVEKGLAQIDVRLGPVDPWTARSFHVAVPIEEQHVTVIYVGATRFPVWERRPGAKDCAR